MPQQDQSPSPTRGLATQTSELPHHEKWWSLKNLASETRTKVNEWGLWTPVSVFENTEEMAQETAQTEATSARGPALQRYAQPTEVPLYTVRGTGTWSTPSPSEGRGPAVTSGFWPRKGPSLLHMALGLFLCHPVTILWKQSLHRGITPISSFCLCHHPSSSLRLQAERTGKTLGNQVRG